MSSEQVTRGAFFHRSFGTDPEQVKTWRTRATLLLLSFLMFPVIGFSTVIGQASFVVLMFLPVGIFLALRRPFVILTVFLIVALSVFNNPAALPGIALGGGERGNVFLQDILLVLLLGSCFVRALKDHRRSWRSVSSVLLVLLLIWVMFSAVYGMAVYGYELISTINALKLYFGYCIFFAALTLAGSRDDLERLLRVLIYFSIVVSFAYVCLSLLGFETLSTVSILGITQLFPISADSDFGNVRLYVPATSLAIMMLLVTSSLFFHSALNSRWWLYGLAMAANAMAVIFTFTRGDWISTAISILLIGLLAPGRRKFRFVLISVGGALVLVFALELLGTRAHSGNISLVSVVSDTFFSLFQTGYEDVNGQGRLIELQAALQLWERSPIIGLGIAATWNFYPTVGTTLIGNHMNLGMLLPRLGLIGGGLYILVLVWYLIRIVAVMRLTSEDMFLRSIVLGFGFSGLQIVVTGFLSSGGLFDYRSLLFFFAMGVVEAVYRVEQYERHKVSSNNQSLQGVQAVR